jgi:hypothetical protein
MREGHEAEAKTTLLTPYGEQSSVVLADRNGRAENPGKVGGAEHGLCRVAEDRACRTRPRN